MKIVHILMETAHGPLSWADLTSGGRGVTGSEQALLYLAKAQADVGHNVVCYMPTDRPGFQVGCEVLDIRTTWPRLRRADTADVVISWLTADPLRHIGTKPLKIHSLQINDWLLNAAGYDNHVDIFVVCSEAHRRHLWSEQGAPSTQAPVVILPNGTELTRFSQHSENRIPRRIVYLSSPDRGLHWLLAMWPEIRFAYPDAELHIFYEVQKWLDNAMLLNSEVGLRAKYVVRKVHELNRHGVRVRGALSPADLAVELAQASVMLYPCDPVRFTEGFGVAVLDACASGVVPIITDADAFGEVYGSEVSGITVVPRGNDRRWTDRFLENALKLLENTAQIEERRNHVREFSKHYDWAIIAKQWEEVIEHGIKRKRNS